jgi:dynein intermediate chain 1
MPWQLLDLTILQQVERMVVQNIFDDISQDFKFWEDPTDALKEKDGSLLPLWKFAVEATKKKHVTSLRWHPAYHDLFAAGYGSYDFVKQAGGGLVCLFSLKNPAQPLLQLPTASGVLSLDFNPWHERLLLIGHYDGSVAVYSVDGTCATLIVQATVRSGFFYLFCYI